MHEATLRAHAKTLTAIPSTHALLWASNNQDRISGRTLLNVESRIRLGPVLMRVEIPGP
jgi:hypothetical protein